MLIPLVNFRGERPRVSRRLLQPNEAQTARNVKLWSGKLRPWYAPKREALTNLSGTHGIYKYFDQYWLRWPVDVDVVPCPVCGLNRIFWSGDGAPKFGNVETIAGRTTLTELAVTGAVLLKVNNAKGFQDNDPLEVQLNSGTHTTTVSEVDLENNQLTLAAALPGAASSGRQVVSLNTAYPRSHYLLGVPAPASPPTVTVQQNTGTVVDIVNFIAEASNSNQTTLDVTIDSEGLPINFRIFAKVFGEIFGLQSRRVTLTVTRDPAGDAEVIFEKTAIAIRQGAVAGQRDYYPQSTTFSWSTDDENPDDYLFTFSPAAGSFVYRLVIADDFVPAFYGGSIIGKQYALTLTARHGDGRVELEIAPSGHGLKEGDKIQFAGITGTETLNNLNKEPVSIVKVTGNLIEVEAADAFGLYDTGGTWTQAWDEEDLVIKSYVYTHVASFAGQDMEGPPSAASEQILVGERQPVLVGGLIDPRTSAAERPYSKLRIYRLAVGTLDEDYLFVAEVPIGTASYTDNKRGTELGEVLPSTLWDPPPEDLVNLIELPNGVLAGIRRSSNQIMFSEPYQPHAWPDTYKRFIPDETVACQAFGSSIVVGTKGRPTLLTGEAPAELSQQHLETIHPCLSKRGMVDMGYAVLYPSRTGLVMAGEGIADVVTHDLFSPDEWQALKPASFVAGRYDDRYLAFFDSGLERAGFIIDPKEPASTLTFLDLWGREIWSDPESGELYLVQLIEDGNEEIIAWNADTTAKPLSYRYRSKEFVFSLPQRASLVKVDAGAYPVKINLFMDGLLYDTMDVFSEAPARVIDELGRGRKWEVEVIGNTEVDAVYVASNMRRLTQYLSGMS